MKRIFIELVCACFLLTGCSVSSNAPIQTEYPPTELPATQPQTAPLPLLEQGTVLEESNNLLYIPNLTVEGMMNPEVRLLGNGLLLSEHIDNACILNHISLEDGSLITSASIPAGIDTKLYIGSGEIGLCDRESGLISILNESFQLRKTYEIPREGDDWYLNTELDTLYIFDSSRGLLVRNLETGETFWLVENGFRVKVIGSSTTYVIFEYTDRENQKTYTRCLNLSTAILETLPISGTFVNGIRQGETWLLQNSEPDGLHTLVNHDAAYSFFWHDSAVQLLPLRRHLLGSDPSGRNLTLYGSDGTFLSQCALPQNSHAITGSDFVWSGFWEGYFFTDYMDSACRLMFWDVDAHSEGTDLQISSLEQSQQIQTVLEPQLYEKAEQLSNQFGVDIRIGEGCTLDYSHYDTYALTDPVFIRSALDILEESLSRYPEGFFRQLTYGSIESIRIELVGSLTAKSGIDTHPASIGAFAQNRGSYYTIVLDAFLIQPQTVFHELSHIIDARLEWDSLIREDALFSEQRWMALQPEDFHYTMTYTEIPEEQQSFVNSGYFITDYSMTFPTEDRAVLMAAAMENYSWDFEPGTGRREKLRYYADCIRDCFDTTDWPETTSWEQVLE